MGINDDIDEIASESTGESVPNPTQAGENQVKTQSGNGKLPEFLQGQTGSGNIESRLDHPMNFRESEGLAQIIRGLEGKLDNLNLWFVDVSIGFLREVWDMVSVSSDSESSENSGINEEVSGDLVEEK